MPMGLEDIKEEEVKGEEFSPGWCPALCTCLWPGQMFRGNSSYIVGTCIGYLENFLHLSLIPDLLGSLSCNYFYIPSSLASRFPVPRSLCFSPGPSTKPFRSARQLFWAGYKLNLWKQPCALPLSHSLARCLAPPPLQGKEFLLWQTLSV